MSLSLLGGDSLETQKASRVSRVGPLRGPRALRSTGPPLTLEPSGGMAKPVQHLDSTAQELSQGHVAPRDRAVTKNQG